MIKRLLIVLVCFIMVFSLVATASASSQVKITTTCQIVDTLDNVKAYYRPGTVANDATNTTYSCAAFAKRYFSSIYGVTLSNLLQNATPIVSRGKLTKVSTPRKGDLVFWPNINNSCHSAIVKCTSGSNVILIEQNWKSQSNGSWYTTKERSISQTSSGVKFYRWSAN